MTAASTKLNDLLLTGLRLADDHRRDAQHLSAGKGSQAKEEDYRLDHAVLNC